MVPQSWLSLPSFPLRHGRSISFLLSTMQSRGTIRCPRPVLTFRVFLAPGGATPLALDAKQHLQRMALLPPRLLSPQAAAMGTTRNSLVLRALPWGLQEREIWGEMGAWDQSPPRHLSPVRLQLVRAELVSWLFSSGRLSRLCPDTSRQS